MKGVDQKGSLQPSLLKKINGSLDKSFLKMPVESKSEGVALASFVCLFVCFKFSR